ncbi:radical SAM family heme chaperone HemW [bacterium]|nr:radical SAM family heme chaperone HemW [bacterium]
MTENVYIHIPFCRRKCNYCSFISFSSIDKKEQYLDALKKEIQSKYKNEKLKTLYFGGGTPSLLEASDFSDIISLFDVDNSTEITTELNPENLTKEYLKNLKKCGINRISMGCQTFNNDILKIIGRQHTAQEVVSAVKSAQDIGFDNISLDFIYGLPKQNIDDFAQDLTTAIQLGVKHISLYGLKIDDGCYFYKNPPENLPDDETQANMYLKAIEIMTQNGFAHYEISNFCRPNFESRHNLNYWNNNSYYGFGVAAHGYLDGNRYSNPVTIEKYLENPTTPQETKHLTEQEKLEEEIFLGLRRMDGINSSLINEKYNIDFKKKYKNILDKYTASGHITKTENGYKFTVNGILVSNYILADFLD